jgi:hypothetical protein
MSEPSIEELSPPTEPPAPPRRRRYRALTIALGVALAVQLAVVLAAPYWAPELLAVLPWGGTPDAKLAERIERLEAALDRSRQAETQQAAAMDQLGRRIAGLEAKQNEQQQAATKAATSAQQLEPRTAALETAQKQEQQGASNAANHLKQIEGRIATLEAKPEPSASDSADLRQQIEKLAAAQSDLTAKLAASEKTVPAQSAADPTDTALLLTILQIREAVQTGRPFAAEQKALAALARNRPEIGDAAASLAEASNSGVASRAVLARRLHELAGSIADPGPKPAEADWRREALAKLRGLVTIRRIGGAAQTGPETAVRAAETALAGGDLAGAIAALDKLTGGPGETARPWLQMARQREQVEETLKRIEAALTARLGKPAESVAPLPSPG